jgi:hypothetical protein
MQQRAKKSATMVRLGSLSPRNTRPSMAHHSGFRLSSNSALAVVVQMSEKLKPMSCLKCWFYSKRGRNFRFAIHAMENGRESRIKRAMAMRKREKNVVSKVVHCDLSTVLFVERDVQRTKGEQTAFPIDPRLTVRACTGMAHK